MKTILTLKGARKYKAQLEEIAKAYAEFEKTLDELQLQDGVNVIQDQKKTVQQLETALRSMNRRLFSIGNFFVRYDIYETEELD